MYVLQSLKGFWEFRNCLCSIDLLGKWLHTGIGSLEKVVAVKYGSQWVG
jgi:hypothetical protein